MTSPGIDISGYQTTTPSLTGQTFCIVKATEGLWTDPMYATHIGNVRKAGIVTGAYHFARSDVSTPTKQAQNFLAVAGNVDLYALDVEGAFAFSLAQSTEFIAAIHAAGKRIGMYHSLSGFPYAGQDWDWVAYYNPTPPPIHYDIWQHGGVAIGGKTVDGDTAVDLGALLGGDMQLDRIVYQSWTANGTNGVLRDAPDRSLAPSIRLPAGTPIISIGEYDADDGNNWRAAEWPVGTHAVRWFLRYGPGIAADHDFIAGPFVAFGASPTELLTAKQAGYDLAVSGASVGVPKVTFPPRPVA